MQKNTLLAINECDFGSTGYISRTILNYCKKDYDVYLAVFRSGGNWKNPYIISSGKFIDFINRALCRIDGSDGFHNKRATKKLLKWLDIIKPSLISLHNVHGRYINIPMLFEYCQKKEIKIYWTLHDCWAFTGKCPHFEGYHCDKWENCCGNCPSKHDYPASYIFDRSKYYFLKKKDLFNKYRKIITIVTPSEWLYNYAKKSILSRLPMLVINNGISVNNCISSQKKDLAKIGSKVFLFVTPGYSKKKGIDFINKLADELLPYHISFICVGIQKRFKNRISKNVQNVGYLKNKADLNFYYDICDALINPTLEDNFPTVNLEAQSRGKPVICFNTGGCAETINEKTGILVEKENYKMLKEAIIKFDKTKFQKDDCLNNAIKFSDKKMCEKYKQLFEK